jgi:hypothetical protein
MEERGGIRSVVVLVKALPEQDGGTRHTKGVQASAYHLQSAYA